MALIKFTRNYNDKSTDTGFQFEFYCDRCGNGFESTFQTSATGMLSQGLDTAASVLGRIFGGAARLGEGVHSAAWHQQKADRRASQVLPRVWRGAIASVQSSVDSKPLTDD